MKNVTKKASFTTLLALALGTQSAPGCGLPHYPDYSFVDVFSDTANVYVVTGVEDNLYSSEVDLVITDPDGVQSGKAVLAGPNHGNSVTLGPAIKIGLWTVTAYFFINNQPHTTKQIQYRVVGTISPVSYDNFLPPAAISGPPGNTCNRGASIFQLWYAGDNRTFGPPPFHGYRNLQRAILVPEQTDLASGLAAQSQDTGISKDYPSDAIINGAPDPTIPYNDPVDDCIKLNAVGQLNPFSIANAHTAARVSTHSVSLEMQGDGTNPLTPPSLTPGITWDLYVKIDSTNPAAIQYQLIGTHDCFPAHEVLIRGQSIYQFTPANYNPSTLVSCLNGINQVNLDNSPVTGSVR